MEDPRRATKAERKRFGDDWLSFIASKGAGSDFWFALACSLYAFVSVWRQVFKISKREKNR